MKKIIVRILIGLGILIGLIVISFLALIYKFDSEAKKMTPLETKLVIDGIYSIYNKPVNFFVIQNNDKYIAIDAGTNLKLAENELKKLNIDPQKITDVFLTHTDYDHVGAIKLFKNAKVFISKEEEQMINGKIHRQLFFDNRLACKYELLNDNQEINISDLKVKCILTPGHTHGSMSYLINDKYLFTGDTLSLHNGEVSIFNKFFNMDTETEKTSITKLSHLTGVGYLITAHHGFTGDFKKAFENWNK